MKLATPMARSVIIIGVICTSAIFMGELRVPLADGQGQTTPTPPAPGSVDVTPFEIKDCALLLRMSGLLPAMNLRELRDRLREELDYLRGWRFLKSDFVDLLGLFQLDERFIRIGRLAGSEREIDITIHGPWLHTILFEVPVLAIEFTTFVDNHRPSGEAAFVVLGVTLYKQFAQHQPRFDQSL